MIAAKAGSELTRESTVTNPVLWSVEHPVLYTNITEIFRDGRLADRVTTPFGIRQISFDTDKGFCLNGLPLKLRGGCFHGDNGPLGAASYDRAEERKVRDPQGQRIQCRPLRPQSARAGLSGRL